jgi:inhibitor of cysteine peptidase
MVQKEIIRKTRAYGLMAILLASVFAALIFSYGTTPFTSLPNASPNPSPAAEQFSPMKTFSSYDELKNFLTTNSPNSYWTRQSGNAYYLASPSPVPAPAPTGATFAAITGGAESKDYSTTNIQVAGVDEADTVKTDGKYLYVIANNSIYILDANPQNARVVNKIPFENASLSGIYLSQEGDKLAVLGNQYVDYSYYEKTAPTGADIMIYPYYRNGMTFAYVYDVSNKSDLQLARNFTMSGNYLNSRMIGNYVYNIVTENAYFVNDTVLLPAVYTGLNASEIEASNIYYANVTYNNDYYSYTYTTFTSLNLMDDAQAPTNMTIMLGGADTVYVSPSNIYVTYPVWEWQETPLTDSSPIGIILPAPMPIRAPSTTKTSIYRIHISENSMKFSAQGNVTGTVLNQYSMDESNGYFRIATTAYNYDGVFGTGTQQNNVYVLDMNLNTVGKLENLGTGENFHAARFMGNRCYLVTYLKTDPLFVIDLSQPANPKVLGELVIPGYSDYLHPYDETHLIGLGKEAVAATEGDFAWYQGLKLSLFDVSNVNAPTEVAKIVIGNRGTSSEALYEPKAFLFERSKDLLVIPVELYLIDGSGTAINPQTTSVPIPTTMPGQGSSGASTYGKFVWQGAYVFNVTLNGGFEVKGNVTQLSSDILANLAQNNEYYYYGYDNGYNYWITRSLYIGNTLYTISDARVQLNNLDNMALIATVDLN